MMIKISKPIVHDRDFFRFFGALPPSPNFFLVVDGRWPDQTILFDFTKKFKRSNFFCEKHFDEEKFCFTLTIVRVVFI
jgi:hypothetical protein